MQKFAAGKFHVVLSQKIQNDATQAATRPSLAAEFSYPSIISVHAVLTLGH
jgi:hypothetical protein